MANWATSFESFLFEGDGLRTTVSLLAISVGLIFTYYSYRVSVWYSRIRAIGQQVDKLPGPKKDFIFGNFLQHPGLCERAFFWMLEQSELSGGKLFRWWMGPARPAVALTHPDTIKIILKTAEPKSVDGDVYNMVVPWLGDGLLVSSGDKWQRNRRLLTPAFHFDILKPYMKIYNESVEKLMNKWKLQLEASPVESIEICSQVSLLTLDIILKCAFSYESSVQDDNQKNLYSSYVLSLAEMIEKRFFTLPWHFDWYYKHTSHGKLFLSKCNYVHKVAEDIIANRKDILRKNPNAAKSKYVDFLDILLLAKDEAGNGLSDLEIRDEVDTFLFEGHDTTSSAIFWCLYNLGSHPDIQQRAFEEVRSILENRNSSEITWDDLSEMYYLTMCVKESLRLHTVVPFVGRQLSRPMEIEGVTLLPGTIIDICPWAVHHNPDVWGNDHMEYRPERFEIENFRKMDSHAFIPFSAGPRNCIGQSFAMHEVKTVVARILNSFRLEVDTSHPIEMLPELVLRSKHGIKLFMTPRQHSQ